MFTIISKKQCADSARWEAQNRAGDMVDFIFSHKSIERYGENGCLNAIPYIYKLKKINTVGDCREIHVSDSDLFYLCGLETLKKFGPSAAPMPYRRTRT